MTVSRWRKRLKDSAKFDSDTFAPGSDWGFFFPFVCPLLAQPPIKGTRA